MSERKPGNPSPAASMLDWPDRAGVAVEVMLEVQRQVRARRRRRLQAGAALAMVCLMALVWSTAGRAPRATAIVSLPARQTLPDGTTVELKEGARIRTAFTAGSRRVELVQGEAHFQVTKDPRRPFVVAAGEVEVRAVGTGFAVQRGEAGVEVLVTEGRVAIERAEAAPLPAQAESAAAAPLAMLEAGRRTMVTAQPEQAPAVAPEVTEVSAGEIAQRLAWRVPRLEFSSTPLSEAVEVINGHSDIQLVLGESSLGELRVSGVVRADNIAALLQLLSAEFGLTTRRGDAGELILVSAR